MKKVLAGIGGAAAVLAVAVLLPFVTVFMLILEGAIQALDIILGRR